MARLKCIVALLLLVAACPSHAAKILVRWVNPTLNTNGTALNNLAFIRLEWGSCAGTAFGTAQASILIAAPATTGAVYPTGLTTVCIRAFARNTDGAESGPSNVAVKNLLPTTGKPVTLGQPILLE